MGVNLTYLQGYATSITTIINSYLVPVLITIAFIVFLYGIAQAFIFSQGDETAIAKGRGTALWGIIGFVIILSVWGIVNIAIATLIPANTPSTTPSEPTL